MTTVCLYLHTGRPEAIDLGLAVSRWAGSRGLEVVAPATEAAVLAAAGTPVGIDAPGPDGPRARPDLVVSIGGDGTILRATRRAVEADADILGVNLGQLGYLAEIEPGGWELALSSYLAGGHRVAERLLVASRVEPAANPDTAAGLPPALNEVVVEKQAMGRTVRLGVSIDGRFFTSYVADGLIIATPTGSTAYSLSARGPVVAPTLRALLLTPVSPHSLFDRPMVLEPSSTVEIEVLGDRSAGVAVDGDHQVLLDPGAKVVVSADPRPARFVTFGERDFHRILKVKFGLSDR